MKKIINKYILTIGLIVSAFSGFSQTGINTRNPEPSSVLDINATDKGVLMPKYTLGSLTDNVFPVNNPQEGALIYNIGGTHERGYYYWDGAKWDKMVVNNEMDQIFNIQLYEEQSSGSNQLIPANTYTTNYVNFTSYSNRTIISTIEGASVSGQNISLPAGKYKVDITLTASAPTTNHTSSNRLYVHPSDPNNKSLDLYGVDVQLMLGTTSIAPMKYASTISGTGSHNNIQGYRYYFVFELTNPVTNLRLNLKQATGRTNDQPTNLAHTGLMVSFRKFLE